MRRLKCLFKGHLWMATDWVSNQAFDRRYYTYCTQCGKKRINHA